jgi:transcriptional regulator with XRE-family HTH domain
VSLRSAKQITSADLAQRICCSTSSIQRVEQGTRLPTQERLSRWAMALGEEGQLQALLALMQEDAREARQAGARSTARVRISRIQAPRS